MQNRTDFRAKHENSILQHFSFRVVNNSMYTYQQVRDGFSYFYPKRKELEDGVFMFCPKISTISHSLKVT